MAAVHETRVKPLVTDSGGVEMQSPPPEKKENSTNMSGGGEERLLKPEIEELRRRWELASVLNFLTVFEPMLGRDLRISAEEIEAGLISPNSSLAQLHITLLKGIPPVSKALNGSDAWVTILCKKLAPWWPWVAEGENPLVANKGEEIYGYRELNPTKRLLMLKALCEVRLEQHDAPAYINDALKRGTHVSSFCKEKIAGDGNGTAFWYEGNRIAGHRLYRGVTTIAINEKSKGRNCLNLPSFQWETLATDLEGFRKVVDEFSSSNVVAETVVCRNIEAEAIPSLEKIQKKKELEMTRILQMKRKQEQAMNLNKHRSPYCLRPTRMCRSHKPVNYTYDDYDRSIFEAIRQIKKGTRPEEQEGKESDDHETGGRISAGADGNSTEEKKMDLDDSSRETACSEGDTVDGSGKKDDTIDLGMIQDTGSDDQDYTYSSESNTDDNDFNDSGESELVTKSKKTGRVLAPRHFGVRWSSRLAGATGESFREIDNSGTKKRMRQRPTLNSNLDTVIVPDSEDDS